jgi:hypothetical protein
MWADSITDGSAQSVTLTVTGSSNQAYKTKEIFSSPSPLQQFPSELRNRPKPPPAAAMGDYGNAMMRNQDAGVQSRVKAQSRANLLQLKLVSLRLLSAPYLNPNPSSPPSPFDFVYYL